MSGYENFRFVVQILFSTLQEKKLCDRLFDTFHTIVVVESSTYLTSKVATISALYFVIFHFSCSGNLSGRLSRWLQLIFPLKVAFFRKGVSFFRSPNLEKNILQKTILSLKFKFPANNTLLLLAGNLNFKLRIVFWNIFFLRFGL